MGKILNVQFSCISRISKYLNFKCVLTEAIFNSKILNRALGPKEEFYTNLRRIPYITIYAIIGFHYSQRLRTIDSHIPKHSVASAFRIHWVRVRFYKARCTLTERSNTLLIMRFSISDRLFDYLRRYYRLLCLQLK